LSKFGQTINASPPGNENGMRSHLRLQAALASAIAMLAAVVSAPPAAATTDSYFYFPRNVLSRQFQDGSCVYKIIFGEYNYTPYAAAHFFAGDCGTDLYPVPVVSVLWAPDRYSSVNSTFGGSEPCGGFFGAQAVGARNNLATGMVVYFPRTDSRKIFTYYQGKDSTTPRGPFC
jgi:hypothetical protein